MLERIRGRDGRTMREVWAETGMRSYLGTASAGFPNLFLTTGPNTGTGHTSLLVMIEAQIGYIVRCLTYMQRRRATVIEVRPEVVDELNASIQDRMARTVWVAGGCSSWYLDDRGRNTTLWPDFTWRFRRLARRFSPEDYVIEVAEDTTQRVPA
jgi:hypothetical protein